jgi:hypothetical protein
MEIRELRERYGRLYAAASVFGSPPDAAKARAVESELAARVRELREKVDVDWAERVFDLPRQYAERVDLLKEAKLVEAATLDGREVLSIRGIDGRVYPVPSYESVVAGIVEQKELFAIKADQGFVKLLLVPFGMSLDEMIALLSAYLLANKDRIPKFEADPKKTALDEATPVLIWDEYAGADQGDALVYDPSSFSEGHGGKTKAEILAGQGEDADASAGWRILFLQPGKDGKGVGSIPRSGKGGNAEGTKAPRKAIEAGRSPNQYLEDQKTNATNESSPYRGESGMCPEEWIVAFITHFEERKGEDLATRKAALLLDDYEGKAGSVAYLTGAWFPDYGGVPFAGWVRGGRQAYLDRRDQDAGVVSYGVRSAVRM